MKKIDKLLLKALARAKDSELQLWLVMYGWDSETESYKILLDFLGGSTGTPQRKEITCSTEEEMDQRVQAEVAAHPPTGKDRRSPVLFNVWDMAYAG